MTFVSVLDGIIEYIDKHLAVAHHVTYKSSGDVRVYIDIQLYFRSHDPDRDHIDDIVKKISQIIFRFLHNYVTVIIVRKYEKIIKSRDQCPAGIGNVMDILPGIIGYILGKHDLSRTHYRIHGCPDLMRHIHQKYILGSFSQIRLLTAFLRLHALSGIIP